MVRVIQTGMTVTYSVTLKRTPKPQNPKTPKPQAQDKTAGVDRCVFRVLPES